MERWRTRQPLHLSDMRASFGRVPTLDGLRAVSIVLVMLSHYVDSRLFPGGFGVLVFFVVSGFLITRLLYAETNSAGRVSLGNFYARRFFRLYPVVTVYAAFVVLFFLATHRPIDWSLPLSTLFYFANYVYALRSLAPQPGPDMPFAVFWSLSIEEHFYLIFPLLFVLLRRRALIVTLALVCILCLASRIILAALHPEWLDSKLFYYTDIRADSIVFGVLLAAMCETLRGRSFVTRLTHPLAVGAAVSAIILCLVVRDPWFRETLRYSLLAASIAVILAALVFSGRYRAAQAFLNMPLVVWIGQLSYSLYVWHTLMPILVRQFAFPLSHAAEAPVLFAGAVIFAAASYYGLERPTAALRYRFGSQTVPAPREYSQDFVALLPSAGER